MENRHWALVHLSILHRHPFGALSHKLQDEASSLGKASFKREAEFFFKSMLKKKRKKRRKKEKENT